MHKNKTIVIIENAIGITGAFKAIFDNAVYLKSDYNFVFILPNNAKKLIFDKILSEGFKVYTLPYIEIGKSIKRTLFYPYFLLINAFKFYKICKKENATIIHVNDIFNMVGIVSKLFHKIYLISHVRRMPESFPLPLYKIWVWVHIKFSNVILPVSNANATIFGNIDKVKVVYDQLPLVNNDICEALAKRLLDTERKNIEILYLANYINGKGHNHVVNTAYKLNTDYNFNNFTIKMYGTDYGIDKNIEYKNSLIKKVDELGLKDNFIFNGFVDDVSILYAQNDLAFNFSDSESFSRYSLECLQNGLPLIATNVGGTNEMFEDEVAGFLVEKGNVEKMTLKAKVLIENLSIRQKFNENSKPYVEIKFNNDNTVEKIRKIYENAK
jgi:L-malate glycosyltransferase